MTKTHRSLQSLAPGTRILSGSPSRWSPTPSDGLRMMVVKESGRDALTLLDDKGAERVVELDQYGKSKDWRLGITWTDALPVGPANAVKAYAAVMLEAEGRKPVFLHLEAVEGGRATARLVQPDGLRGRGEQGAGQLWPAMDPGPDGEAEAWSGDVVGNAAIWSEPVLVEVPARPRPFMPGVALPEGPAELADWKPGDLVGGVRFSCRIKDNRTITSLHLPAVVGNFTRDGLGAFMPWGVTEAPAPEGMRDPYGYAAYIGPAGFEDYREEEERARARLEPNEALVVWYRPVGNEPDSTETACSFMGTSGITFLHADAVEDNFYGAGIEEGLWVLTDAKWWTDQDREGGYDSGIDGDWRPATAEDLERFGFTLETASAEIADRIEVDPDPGLAAAMIAKAEEASRAAQPAAPGM